MKTQHLLLVVLVGCSVAGALVWMKGRDRKIGSTKQLDSHGRVTREEAKRLSRNTVEGSERWQDRLPMSMNGEVPSGLPKGFEDKYWHSIRLHQRFSREREFSDLIGVRLFSDPKLDELKDCILRVDIAGMESLIEEEGVDVNGMGKGNITPLFIAFFVDTDPRPFELLLKNGANPNCVSWYDRARPVGNFFGLSVAHLTSIPTYNRLFSTVFEGRGSANVMGGFMRELAPPFALSILTQPDYWERLKLMARNGADFNLEYNYPAAPFLYGRLWEFVRAEDDEQRERSCRMMLLAIEHGADLKQTFEIFEDEGVSKIRWGGCYFAPIHFFAQASLEKGLSLHESKSSNVRQLLQLFVEANCSLDTAIDDLQRWERWKSEGLGELIEIEHQKRMADATGSTVEQWLESEIQSSIDAIRNQQN